MKVLISSYNTCCQNISGGVQIRIKNFYKALSMQKIDVDFFDPFSTNLRDIDILHVFKLDIETLSLVKCAKKLNRKVVLSPIINCENGYKIDLYRKLLKFPLATTYRLLFEYLKIVDLIIVESENEKEFICKHYKINPEKIVKIHNGVLNYKTDDNSIFTILEKNCNYVLQVGRFDKNKNQMSVIKALKDTNIPLVFIGGPDFNDSDYYNMCLREAKNSKNIHFLGWLDNESLLLKSAYSHAKIIILPSYSETFGLSIIEGIIAGGTPIISNTLPIINEPLLKNCLTINPNDYLNIREVIQKNINTISDSNFNELVANYYSWEKVAELHIKEYNNLLK